MSDILEIFLGPRYQASGQARSDTRSGSGAGGVSGQTEPVTASGPNGSTSSGRSFLTNYNGSAYVGEYTRSRGFGANSDKYSYWTQSGSLLYVAGERTNTNGRYAALSDAEMAAFENKNSFNPNQMEFSRTDDGFYSNASASGNTFTHSPQGKSFLTDERGNSYSGQFVRKITTDNNGNSVIRYEDEDGNKLKIGNKNSINVPSGGDVAGIEDRSLSSNAISSSGVTSDRSFLTDSDGNSYKGAFTRSTSPNADGSYTLRYKSADGTDLKVRGQGDSVTVPDTGDGFNDSVLGYESANRIPESGTVEVDVDAGGNVNPIDDDPIDDDPVHNHSVGVEHDFDFDNPETIESDDRGWLTSQQGQPRIPGDNDDPVDPVVTDPVVTDPVVTDPVVTDPVVSVSDQPASNDRSANPIDQTITENDEDLVLVNPRDQGPSMSGRLEIVSNLSEQETTSQAVNMAACFEAMAAPYQPGEPIDNWKMALALICSAYVANIEV